MAQDTNIAPLTRQQVREVDRLAIEELGIPSIVLMENAALHAANTLLHTLRQRRGIAPDQANIAILCGGGNNGGDGYAMARHLHNRGATVTLYALKAPAELRGDALTNCSICQHMDLPILPVPDAAMVDAFAATWAEADALVDAMLGTGFAGQARPPVATAIATINTLTEAGNGPLVLAVDLPSGLNCDTGQPAGDAGAIHATLTVTFVAPKVGFAQPGADRWLGEVVVADIGAPPHLTARVRRRFPQKRQ